MRGVDGASGGVQITISVCSWKTINVSLARSTKANFNNGYKKKEKRRLNISKVIQSYREKRISMYYEITKLCTMNRMFIAMYKYFK